MGEKVIIQRRNNKVCIVIRMCVYKPISPMFYRVLEVDRVNILGRIKTRLNQTEKERFGIIDYRFSYWIDMV